MDFLNKSGGGETGRKDAAGGDAKTACPVRPNAATELKNPRLEYRLFMGLS